MHVLFLTAIYFKFHPMKFTIKNIKYVIDLDVGVVTTTALLHLRGGDRTYNAILNECTPPEAWSLSWGSCMSHMLLTLYLDLISGGSMNQYLLKLVHI